MKVVIHDLKKPHLNAKRGFHVPAYTTRNQNSLNFVEPFNL